MQKQVQTQLQSLMQKEMTRKEFMATLGFGAATVMGFGSLLKLAGVGLEPAKQRHQVSAGYGSGVYGGRRT